MAAKPRLVASDCVLARVPARIYPASRPGIVGIAVEDIWLPGKTTTEEGTGLGLTIVRDAIADLSGTISAEAKGSLGGAQFNLEFPARD